MSLPTKKSLALSSFLVLNLLLSTRLFALYHLSEINLEEHQDRPSHIESFFTEAKSFLPQQFLNEKLMGTISVKFERFGEQDTIFPTPNCSNINEKDQREFDQHIYGYYNSQNHEIILNSSLLYDISNPNDPLRSFKCKHKTMYRQALATLLHETVHAYDKITKTSSSDEFLKISRFTKQVLSAPKCRNVNNECSPDVYEKVNSSENLAVNAEYFFLDKNYAARRPSYYYFLSKLWHHYPFQTTHNQKPLPKKPLMKLPFIRSDNKLLDLSPKRIYQIHYLLADKGKAMESGFGHTMLRLIVCAPKHKARDGSIKKATKFGPKCLKDENFHIVIGFLAELQGKTKSPIKGLIGAYPSVLKIQHYLDVKAQYGLVESRRLKSYPLKLTEEKKTLLIYRILEDYWGYVGKYKFISQNCATEMRNLLQAVLYDSNYLKTKARTPRKVVQRLAEAGFVELEEPLIEEPDRTKALKAIKDLDISSYRVKVELNKLTLQQPWKRLIRYNEIIKKNKLRYEAKAITDQLTSRLKTLKNLIVIEQYALKKTVTKAQRIQKNFISNIINDDKITDKEVVQMRELNQDIAKITRDTTGTYGIPKKFDAKEFINKNKNFAKILNLYKKGPKIYPKLVVDKWKIRNSKKNLDFLYGEQRRIYSVLFKK